MDPPIYLDHATTTKPSDHLVVQMQPFFKRHWLCPTVPYLKGKEPFVTIQRSLNTIKNALGAAVLDTFILTSCGAEAVSHVYHALAIDKALETGRNHFVTTPLEDASFLMGIDRLAPLGIRRKCAPLNEQGILTPENLEKVLTPRTGLVSLSWAHGLTGLLHPIVEIAELCREKGALLHVDVSDVLGKLYFRFEDLPIDFLTFDGDRFHGPKGTGGLLVSHPHQLKALIPGGMHQDGLRGGTLNLPGLVGLQVAFNELEESFDHMCTEITRLRDQFEESLERSVSEITVLFRGVERLPNVSVIAFPGVSAELLAFHLAQRDVFASFGGGRHQRLEALLKLVHVRSNLNKCALSFSLGRSTTAHEIQKASGIIADAAEQCLTCSRNIAL